MTFCHILKLLQNSRTHKISSMYCTYFKRQYWKINVYFVYQFTIISFKTLKTVVPFASAFFLSTGERMQNRNLSPAKLDASHGNTTDGPGTWLYRDKRKGAFVNGLGERCFSLGPSSFCACLDQDRIQTRIRLDDGVWLDFESCLEQNRKTTL